MAKHKHAELMMEYAKDAMESETPWEGWQRFHLGHKHWTDMSRAPTWNPEMEYRRRPKKPTVAGVIFPDMIVTYKDAANLEKVYVLEVTRSINSIYIIMETKPQNVDQVEYALGRVHRTHDSAMKFARLTLPQLPRL